MPENTDIYIYISRSHYRHVAMHAKSVSSVSLHTGLTAIFYLRQVGFNLRLFEGQHMVQNIVNALQEIPNRWECPLSEIHVHGTILLRLSVRLR